MLQFEIKLKSDHLQYFQEMNREQVEDQIFFAGFVIISCPLKPDSKAVVRELSGSSHQVVMITGDNPLTACHVAKQLKISRSPTTVILTRYIRNAITNTHLFR